ncbi:glycoside hydrolase family 28 [Clostridium carboxidivorans P7]|uniref:Glycoside hydrolase family 28 n=1 Tax=Clostridium carboxidivorans P7 TaxID=536227 RepID=C6PP10_9CLOT|nr:glycoside hydrolase family 28 protein [Clostridium carboxidivorans]AKN31240.1 glycoside hydrolase family 28 [Clostridium carboxidivorans P7]EET89088.1 glycoside hydrolase family 28 [Clostridium carboxidivorans P7]EFG88357.1 polygalacturonase (pectinase) [Clostridium carboxidivorans P7]
MKSNRLSALALSTILSLSIVSGCNFKNSNNVKAADENTQLEAYTTNLPFNMPKLSLPTFQNKDFNITDYGAESGSITKNTDAFKKAITECNKVGGGRVVVPAGTWLTGPIELKSNVNLYLDSGALVIFSSNPEDYKKTDEKNSSSNSYKNLISGSNLSNIAITGDGVLNGNGAFWRPVKKEKVTDSIWKSFVSAGGVLDSAGTTVWPNKQVVNVKRPNLLNLSNCKSVLLDGPSFENSPQFNIDINSSENLIVRNTKIFNEYWAQNTDGIDISACKNVLIYNDTVNTGDDGICMKSGSSSKSNNDEPTLENVVIENCIVNHAHGGFVVGSNTDGGMKNIYVHNCNYIGTDSGLRFKSDIGNGGKVEDIYIDGINMKNIVNDAIVFDTNYEAKNTNNTSNKVPNFQNIHISNVFCDGAQEAANIKGLDAVPVKNLDLKNITIKSTNGFSAENTSNVNLDNVKITPSQGSIFTLKNSSGYNFNNVLCPTGTSTFISLEGSQTNNIKLTNTNISNAKQPFALDKNVNSSAITINK